MFLFSKSIIGSADCSISYVDPDRLFFDGIRWFKTILKKIASDRLRAQILGFLLNLGPKRPLRATESPKLTLFIKMLTPEGPCGRLSAEPCIFQFLYVFIIFLITTFLMKSRKQHVAFFWYAHFFPQHLCWGSTFLLPLSVSRFIAGIKLFRPPRATRTPLLLLLLLLLLYLGCCTLLLLYLECIFWKAIFTTLKYLATHPNLLLLYLLLLYCYCCTCYCYTLYKKTIYDIGTKILYLCCFLTKIMFLFCKWLIFSGFYFLRHVDSFADGVKPLKAIFEPKKNRFRFASYENSHTSAHQILQ